MPQEPLQSLRTAFERVAGDSGRVVLGAYELAEHEQIILREACRTVDLLDALQHLIEPEGPVLLWGDGS